MPPVMATASGALLRWCRGLAFRVAGARLLGRSLIGLDAGVGLLGGRLFLGDLGGRRALGEDLLGEIQVRRALDRLGVVGALGDPAALDPLQREREPPPLRVDLDDLRLDEIALRDDLARVLDVVLCELRDVHEPLDPREDLDEGAERDDLRDLALDGVALVGGLQHLLPRIGLRLLEAEGDPLALAVDVEHLDLHVLADLEHLGRMVDVRPRKLGDVDQPVHAVEVDEGAEVDDVRDLAVDDVAGVEPVEDLLPLLLTLVLEDGAAREHDVVARAVELDHLAAELLPEELVEILHAPDVDQRRGQEAADAEVEDQAALDDFDHAAVDWLAGLGRLLDRFPRHLETGSLLRQDEPALSVLLGEDEGIDLVAEAYLVSRVHGAPDRQLRNRDHALRLVADVDQNLVLVDPDHGAVHDLPFVDCREGCVVVGTVVR